MFGQKKAKTLKPLGGFYVDGLPGASKNSIFEAQFNEDKTALNISAGKTEFVLPLGKVQAMEVGSEVEILEKSKSVIGRGAVGALFGPVGAIIGAASGTGTKVKQKKRFYAVISYTGDNGIQNITVELGGADSLFIGQANKFKEALDKELYGDGPIQL
nr:MAG TPA: hypothetical protein [Caudoviricetes sp.]